MKSRDWRSWEEIGNIVLLSGHMPNVWCILGDVAQLALLTFWPLVVNLGLDFGFPDIAWYGGWRMEEILGTKQSQKFNISMYSSSCLRKVGCLWMVKGKHPWLRLDVPRWPSHGLTKGWKFFGDLANIDVHLGWWRENTLGWDLMSQEVYWQDSKLALLKVGDQVMVL